MEVSCWISWVRTNIKLLNKLRKKTQFRRKQGSHVGSLENLNQIPQDWQNTLVRNYPSLRRSNSSSSSFGSSGSASSAYSVNDFLRDLSAGEDDDSIQERDSKTSTPLTCHIVPLNRMAKQSSQAFLVHNVSGLKIYEDNIEKDNTAEPIMKSGTFPEVPQDLYENGAFHQRFYEECRKNNQEDKEDGYEIIVIKNKRSNCRTLKTNIRN